MSDIVGIAACLLSTGVNDVTDTQIPDNPDADDEDDGARTGTCLDGPLAGQELTSRYPKGVLICDRPAGQLFIYDWTDGGFRSRSGSDPMTLVDDPDADDNRWRAAEEGDYDVLAAPWVGDAGTVDAYADQPDNDGEG
jgi:hypothetical protein